MEADAEQMEEGERSQFQPQVVYVPVLFVPFMFVPLYVCSVMGIGTLSFPLTLSPSCLLLLPACAPLETY